MIRPLFSFAIVALVAISTTFAGDRPALSADDNGGSQLGTDKYEIRAAGIGGGAWAAVRFNRLTGDSWTADYDRTSKSAERKFTKIVDEQKIQPGDYDVQLVVMPNSQPAILRIEHSSGKCWEAWAGKWRPLKEETK